jgi:hypothetical protein
MGGIGHSVPSSGEQIKALVPEANAKMMRAAQNFQDMVPEKLECEN